MSIDEIVRDQNRKLEWMLVSVQARLARVEGPNCNRHHPEFNIANHPYYSGIELRMPSTDVLAGLLY